ncbi:MAG: hypothetical protein PHS41_09160 [Victivallaceae bacterium]|nr:hypothetical protein [Victivallaceae bacterium]
MEQYGTLISAIIVVLGWGVVAWFDRRNAIAIERAKHHIEALKTVLDMASTIKENGMNLKNVKIDVSAMQLFAYEDEWKLYQEFITTITTKGYDGRKAVKILADLVEVAHIHIREELGYR